MSSSKGVVKQDANGSWYFDVRVKKKRIKRSGFKTKKEAQKALTEAKAGKTPAKKSHPISFWDNKKLLHMRDAILPNTRTIQEAIRKACEKWDRDVNRSHFVSKFTSHFGHPPKQYIGIKAGPVENPYPEIPPNMNPVILLQKNKELEKEIEKLSKEASEQVSYRAQIEELITGVMSTNRAPDKLVIAPREEVTHHGIPTLAISDVHYGDNLSADVSLSGLPYNRKEAKRRLEYTFTKACEITQSVLAKSNSPCAVLALIGDFFGGYIRSEQRENMDIPILPAVVEMLDILIAGIDLMRSEYKFIYVPCAIGNHSRIDQKPRSIDCTFENYEWILYYMLWRHYTTLGIDNVKVVVPKNHECRFQIYNTRYLMTHGFEFKGGNGITGPLLPWMRGFQKKQQQGASVSIWSEKQKNFDVMLMGHFHQSAYLDSIIVNGPIVEMGEYAHIAQCPYAPSCSNFWFTHPRRGITLPLKIFSVRDQERHSPDDLPSDVIPVFGDGGWEKEQT